MAKVSCCEMPLLLARKRLASEKTSNVDLMYSIAPRAARPVFTTTQTA